MLDWAHEQGGDKTATKEMVKDMCRQAGRQDPIKMVEFLYAKLIECLKQGAESFQLVSNSGKPCALNAWRRLNHRYDPDDVHRNMKILDKLMRPP